MQYASGTGNVGDTKIPSDKAFDRNSAGQNTLGVHSIVRLEVSYVS